MTRTTHDDLTLSAQDMAIQILTFDAPLSRCRRLGMLTPFGWFAVLGVLALVMGAGLAFLT